MQKTMLAIACGLLSMQLTSANCIQELWDTQLKSNYVAYDSIYVNDDGEQIYEKYYYTGTVLDSITGTDSVGAVGGVERHYTDTAQLAGSGTEYVRTVYSLQDTSFIVKVEYSDGILQSTSIQKTYNDTMSKRVYANNNDLASPTYRDWETDRKSTRLNSSHRSLSRMPSSA